MTENEKKLEPLKHQYEKAIMRERAKERKAKTRRLIQEGAILEKAFSKVNGYELREVREFFM